MRFEEAMSSASVALCSYQGEAWIGQQLASIAAQTRLPDEVVVCDDASDDGTAEIVERFAAESPFEVHLVRNPNNMGVVGNFDQAIALCRGEVIFLADQDDVWPPEKIDRFLQVFQQQPHVALVFSDALAIGPEGESLGYRLWDAVQFTRASRCAVARGRLFDVLMRWNVATGAAMAFRSRYRDLVLPIPRECQHDAWIAQLLSAIAPCVALDEPLLHYRQHASQQLGERRLSLLDQFRIARAEGSTKFELIARRHELAAERLERLRDTQPTDRRIDQLREKAAHYRAKIHMRQSPLARLPLAGRELLSGRYCRCARGWKSLAQDLFL